MDENKWMKMKLFMQHETIKTVYDKKQHNEYSEFVIKLNEPVTFDSSLE